MSIDYLSIIPGHERPGPLDQAGRRLRAPGQPELEGGRASEHVELVRNGLHGGHETKGKLNMNERDKPTHFFFMGPSIFVSPLPFAFPFLRLRPPQPGPVGKPISLRQDVFTTITAPSKTMERGVHTLFWGKGGGGGEIGTCVTVELYTGCGGGGGGGSGHLPLPTLPPFAGVWVH